MLSTFCGRFLKHFVLLITSQLLFSNLQFVEGEDGEDVDLLVAYKNKEGRRKISALLDFFEVNTTDIIVDVIYEIGDKLDDIDFDNYSLAELISSVKVPSDTWESYRDLLNGDSNIASVTINPSRVAPPDLKPEAPIDMADRFSLRRELYDETPPGIERVQATELWETDFEEQITVCVVDTGYDLGHVDLPRDFVTGTTPDPSYGHWSEDHNSHGTHCAGTIGALTQNGVGVDSCMRYEANFKFHIGKGLNGQGSGSGSTIMAAIRGCQNNGAKIVSLSLGGSANNPSEAEFYRSKFDEGLLLIAAAGNDGNREKAYPASYGSVMSVAAVEPEATFSQVNNQVEISAPGSLIRSTYPGNRYQRKSGTSMATPHVAGVAALVWSRFPECTNVQIRNILVITAQKVTEEEYSERYGYGLVQAKAAYDLLKSEGCTAADSFENPLINPPEDPSSFGGSDNNGAIIAIIIAVGVAVVVVLGALGYYCYYAKSK